MLGFEHNIQNDSQSQNTHLEPLPLTRLRYTGEDFE
jgi:hypothetical protein